MAANIDPVFSRLGDVQFQSAAMTAANNTLDITSGTSYLVFTADATNGGYVSYIRVTPSPANNTAATVVRVWLNNGAATGTATNSAFFTAATIAATTASATTALIETTIPINLALPAGYRIYLTLGTAPGGSGQFNAAAVGGKY
jgi:hypothetical protein